MQVYRVCLNGIDPMCDRTFAFDGELHGFVKRRVAKVAETPQVRGWYMSGICVVYNWYTSGILIVLAVYVRFTSGIRVVYEWCEPP